MEKLLMQELIATRHTNITHYSTGDMFRAGAAKWRLKRANNRNLHKCRKYHYLLILLLRQFYKLSKCTNRCDNNRWLSKKFRANERT